jgi:hypothetical protein
MLLMVSKEFRDRRDRRTSPPKADRQARGMGDKRNEISYLFKSVTNIYSLR